MFAESEKYFFGTGNGGFDTAVTNWRSHPEAFFRLAESTSRGGTRFAHKPYPDRLRRAFAAEYLDAGVPIETVSLLLGHSSVKVTESTMRSSAGPGR